MGVGVPVFLCVLCVLCGRNRGATREAVGINRKERKEGAAKQVRRLRTLESSLFRSDLLTGHEPSRTRDEDEHEDEKRGQLPPVPHPASRTPHSEGSWKDNRPGPGASNRCLALWPPWLKMRRTRDNVLTGLRLCCSRKSVIFRANRYELGTASSRSRNLNLVEPWGFEPQTFSLRTRRSTN